MKSLSLPFNRVVLFVVIAIMGGTAASAQSGRGRKRVEPPPAPPAPEKQIVIPESGGLDKTETDGLNSRFVLKNGLTIVVSEDHSKSLMSIVACVKVGYANDSEAPSGLALVAAEMFWRGTISRGGIPAQTELQAIGARTSVSVERNQTYFQLLAPSEQADRAAQVVVDAFTRPSLDQAEIQRAIRLVSEENHVLPAEGASWATAQMLGLAYPQHWMQRGRAVPDEALRAMTKEQLDAFYKGFYQPWNAILVVAGDVNTFQLLPPLQKGFGEIKAKKTLPRPAGELAAQTAVHYGTALWDGLDAVYVSVGYPLRQTTAADYSALKVLQTMLTGGEASRLGRVLRDGREVIRSIQCELVAWGVAPTLVFQLAVDPDKIDDAEVAFFTEIEKVRRELPSEGELQRAVSVLELAHYRELQRVDGRARTLAESEAERGSYKEDFKLFAKTSTVTSAQVQKLAAHIFSINEASVFEYLPPELAARSFTPEKYFETLAILIPAIKDATIPADQVRTGESIAPVEQGPEKRQPTESSKFGLSLLPKPVRIYPTLRGPSVFVREDSSLPLVTIGVFFQGGRIVEGENEEGLTELMLRAMMAGSKSKAARDITLRLEQLAASIQLINEPDYFGFLLDVVTRNVEPAFAILHGIIESPAFEKENVARVIQGQLADARRSRANEETRPEELFWSSILPRHPYGRSRFGSDVIVTSATPELVKTWYAATIQRQYPLGVIVGDTEGSALVSRFFAEGFNRREPQTKLQLPIPNVGAGDHVLAEPAKGQQTLQVLGFPASKSESNDVYALAVLQAIAQSRLNADVAGQAGLATSIEVENRQRLGGGAFEVKIVSAPPNEISVRNAAAKQLDDLVAADIGDDVIGRGKVNAETDFDASVQTHHDRAYAYVRAAMLGRRPDTVDQYSDRIDAVTKADVKRVLGDFIKKDLMGVGVLRGKAAPPPPKPPEEKKPATP